MRFGFAPTQSDPSLGAMLRQARRAEAFHVEVVEKSPERFGERVLPAFG